MKIKHCFIYPVLGLWAALFSLGGCASNGAVNTASGETNYNIDLVMGIYWQQYSGEYPALCYQAFNAGKGYINSLPAGGKRAVVLDIDETVLDNSKYAAWMAKVGHGWSSESWEAWCNAGDAYAVPGSLDFTQFLIDHGIEVFYISNRPDSTLGSTITNLAELGFPRADEDHVFLQKTTSDKKPRIDAVTAQGYEVVLYAGDSLEDFDSTTRRWSNDERKAWVDTQVSRFGTFWIVLPNAVYGTFESAIRPDYYGLPLKERAALRLEQLEAWEY